MKRIIIIILFAALLCNLGLFAFAEGVYGTLTGSNVSAERGETVEMTFRLDCAGGIKSMSVSSFAYDNTALTLTGGEWLASGASIKDFNLANKTGAVAFSANTPFAGDVLKMTFLVSENAVFGEYAVILTVTAKEKTTVEKPVTIAYTQGVVTVTHTHVFNVLQSDDSYHWYKCELCDATSGKSAHSGGTATCIAKAACSVCGKFYGGYGDHAYGAWTKMNDTRHQRVCANDPAHIETSAHTWNAGAVTTPATCKATGVKTYTCTVCNATETETIAKDMTRHIGGTEIRNAKSATCGANGYTGDTYCKGCGAKLASGSEIPATGHAYGGWTVEKAATCTEKGSERRVCANDNSHVETRDIVATGHGETEVRNAKAATCTEAGYTGDTYCKVCNTKIADGAEVAATGHSDKNGDGVCDVCGTVQTVPAQPTQPSTAPSGETTTQPSGETTTQNAVETTTQSEPESTTQSAGETTTVPAGESTSQPSGETTTDPAEGQITEPISDSGGEPSTEPTVPTTEPEQPAIPDNIFDNPDDGTVGSAESTGEIRYSSKVALTKSAVVASIVHFEGAVVTVKDKDGNDLADDSAPGTGSTVTVTVGTDTVTKVLIFLGDVDGNGSVNATDARLALRAAAKLDTLEGAFAVAADPDGSKTINATDARMILRAAAKLDDPAGWLAQ
ncbi:MAG: hypothetical protein IJM45_01525 [Clostridia bacterium]|nr:hypothetical protein [Clostridia bacterium]